MKMMRSWLPLLFILVPFLEVYLLIKVGRQIDAIPTIFLIVFTGVLGALLLRHQGLYTMRQVQKSVEQGQMPAMAMIEGVMIMFSGVLLLIPGFLTDTLGLLLLVPGFRRLLIARFIKGLVPMGPDISARNGHSNERGSEQYHADKEGHTIIEGECRREDKDKEIE